jgi:hypothetical protein
MVDIYLPTLNYTGAVLTQVYLWIKITYSMQEARIFFQVKPRYVFWETFLPYNIIVWTYIMYM